MFGSNLDLYVTEFRSTTSEGVCPGSGIGSSNSPVNASELLNTGSTVAMAPVPAGSCRRYVHLIRRLSDGVVVSQMSVNVDNTV